MAGVYYQVRAREAQDAVQCGLKLSEHADREILFPGETQPRRVMTAWLHPEDLPGRFACPSGEASAGPVHASHLQDNDVHNAHVCLRLEVDAGRCMVGDADLYRMGRQHSVLMQRYLSSLTPLRAYRFGSFRSPECLISASVLDSQIAVMGRAMDVAVLYESSETLYLQTCMAAYGEASQDSGNGLLFAWCRLLESKGLMERFSDETGNREVYVSRKTGGMLVLEVSDRKDAEVWP